MNPYWKATFEALAAKAEREFLGNASHTHWVHVEYTGGGPKDGDRETLDLGEVDGLPGNLHGYRMAGCSLGPDWSAALYRWEG